MKLIDADALKEQTTKRNSIWDYASDIYGRGLTEIIDSMPTIEERKKGKWIHEIKKRRLHVIDPKVITIEVIFFARPKCSECGFEIAHETHFCPNCGARMEGIDETD